MLNLILYLLALVVSIAVLVTVVLIGEALGNGKSIHFLTLAFAYAVGVRIVIVANAVGWTSINTNILGNIFYVLLLIGFLILLRNIKKIRQVPKENL